jgi:hypothetical protein
MITSLCKKKREFMRKYQIFKILKFFCETKIISKLKKLNSNSKVEAFRLKYLKLKIFKCMKSLFNNIKNRKVKIIQFRNLSLKVKIFKLLQTFKKKSLITNNNFVSKFKNYYLKIKFFNMMHKYIYKSIREHKIISKLKIWKINKKKKLMQYSMMSWKKYYILQKYKKIKQLRLIMKIFYAIKFYLKQ